ncbi:MAG: hypothetical protein L3J35_08320 [Bacteroidales bacterium]|nr:hypothetical protein [Bacteroidales bacterium]
MKKTIFFLFILTMSLSSFSENISLKITYNGKGVSGHTVTVSIGGNKLGSGITNNNGDVSISVPSLPVKDIDVAGVKECNGGKKSWEVKGFVRLDNNNFAHLKMEIPVKELVEASGGMMSESMIISSYGLICGQNSRPNTNTNSANNNTSTNSSSSNNNTNNLPIITKEESLANQKIMLENKISGIEARISKKKTKLNSGAFEGGKKNNALYDVKELEIEKLISENKLNKVNQTIADGRLNKAQRNQFKAKDEELKDELKQVKEDRKKGVSLLSEDDKLDFLKITDEELKEMSTFDLKNKKIRLNTTLSKKKIKLKTKKRFLSPNELKALEEQISTIKESILTINNEIAKRGEDAE